MYMAPEVLEARDGDALGDPFSFCVMPYEALYRARPFRDRYRDAWLAMRVDAWRATDRRQEQSARLLEPPMRCLDRLADEMDPFLRRRQVA